MREKTAFAAGGGTLCCIEGHMSVESTNIPASEALQRLRDGNQRYHQNVRSVDAPSTTDASSYSFGSARTKPV